MGDCSLTVAYPWKMNVPDGFKDFSVSDLLSPPNQWFTTNPREWNGNSIRLPALTEADVLELVCSCKGGQTNVIGLDDVDVELCIPLL